MKTHDFWYDLPEELIAQTPLEQRDTSRLLVLDRETGKVKHQHFFAAALDTAVKVRYIIKCCCGCSKTVMLQLPKLATPVRLRSPAPFFS